VTPCSFELVFLKTFISLVDAGNMEHTEQVQVFRRCLLSPSAVRQLLSPSTLIDCYLRTDHSSNLHVQRPSKWTWCQLCVCVCVCVCVCSILWLIHLHVSLSSPSVRFSGGRDPADFLFQTFNHDSKLNNKFDRVK